MRVDVHCYVHVRVPDYVLNELRRYAGNVAKAYERMPQAMLIRSRYVKRRVGAAEVRTDGVVRQSPGVRFKRSDIRREHLRHERNLSGSGKRFRSVVDFARVYVDRFRYVDYAGFLVYVAIEVECQTLADP